MPSTRRCCIRKQLRKMLTITLVYYWFEDTSQFQKYEKINGLKIYEMWYCLVDTMDIYKIWRITTQWIELPYFNTFLPSFLCGPFKGNTILNFLFKSSPAFIILPHMFVFLNSMLFILAYFQFYINVFFIYSKMYAFCSV